MSDFFEGASAHDIAMLAIVVFGMPAMLMVVVTWVLKFFVGLKATPDHRAFLTVLPAYVLVTLAFLLGWGGEGLNQIMMPLAAIPGALIIYWWWRREFRAAWVDSAEQLPEGVGLANDDWKIGVAAVVMLVVAAAIKMLFLKSSI